MEEPNEGFLLVHNPPKHRHRKQEPPPSLPSSSSPPSTSTPTPATPSSPPSLCASGYRSQMPMSSPDPSPPSTTLRSMDQKLLDPQKQQNLHKQPQQQQHCKTQKLNSKQEPKETFNKGLLLRNDHGPGQTWDSSLNREKTSFRHRNSRNNTPTPGNIEATGNYDNVNNVNNFSDDSSDNNNNNNNNNLKLLLAPPGVRASQQYVKLNVGGHLFVATLSTLTRQQNNMLSSMFSGRQAVVQDEDGFINIDRDGRFFSLILNYLRDGTVALPDKECDKLALLAEAKFYLLDGLVDEIQDSLKPQLVVPRCAIPVISCDAEEQALIEATRHGSPMVKFAYNRSNNKFSYTSPSDDALLKNLELFDKISTKFHGRVLYVKDIGGKSGHICTWFFYGNGKMVAEVCCTSMVYAAERKQTKIEFPEARLYEENMNILLYERKQKNGYPVDFPEEPAHSQVESPV
eukprot:m.44273 g.44273  ORF g.44273 m.44273 type:complete len:459 (-) comp17231_c0_seq4:39-1415(-)